MLDHPSITALERTKPPSDTVVPLGVREHALVLAAIGDLAAANRNRRALATRRRPGASPRAFRPGPRRGGRRANDLNYRARDG